MTRRILIVANPHRDQTRQAAIAVEQALRQAGIEPATPADGLPVHEFEAAIVLGGDGTMLHAAELMHGADVPLLGVNLGRMGFLAELEKDHVVSAAHRLAAGDYSVEPRFTLEVTVTHPDGTQQHGWALNEATLERTDRLRTLEVAIDVDATPLSSFGCDAIVVSTATGSTAHAFSAGGPVLWPDVDALLMVPIAAHALFARPLVVGPASVFGIEVAATSGTAALVVLDGARTIEAPRGGRVVVRRGEHTVRLARMTDAPFTDRLVQKFSLPTHGWRGERARTTPIGTEIGERGEQAPHEPADPVPELE